MDGDTFMHLSTDLWGCLQERLAENQKQQKEINLILPIVEYINRQNSDWIEKKKTGGSTDYLLKQNRKALQRIQDYRRVVDQFRRDNPRMGIEDVMMIKRTKGRAEAFPFVTQYEDLLLVEAMYRELLPMQPEDTPGRSVTQLVINSIIRKCQS